MSFFPQLLLRAFLLGGRLRFSLATWTANVPHTPLMKAMQRRSPTVSLVLTVTHPSILYFVRSGMEALLLYSLP